jgi:hypothetical protein
LFYENLNFSFVIGIPPEDQQQLLIQNILKFLWFEIQYINKVCRYRFKSFGRPADEHKFTDNTNKQITVMDYLQATLGIRLCYPSLPVVEVYNPADKNQSYFLPIELVIVAEGKSNLQPVTTEQCDKLTKKKLLLVLVNVMKLFNVLLMNMCLIVIYI